MTVTSTINIDHRPSGYFGPQRLEEHLLANIKGSVLRAQLKRVLQAGDYDGFNKLLGDGSTSDHDRKVLESIHPMFMGGNYLPDREEQEVEIARIRIASTTFDVTSVYARSDNGKIHYRVVDEYGGDTLSGEDEMVGERPLTLGELHEFFIGAWPLHDVLVMNFEGDVEGMLGFFEADSEFYPELDELCRKRVVQAFLENPDED
jgi:hypothetical protein